MFLFYEIRNHVAEKICKALSSRSSREMADVRDLGKKIEEAIFVLFPDDVPGKVDTKYKKKFRSLYLNIMDKRNSWLFQDIISGEISPNELVSKSPEELAFNYEFSRLSII